MAGRFELKRTSDHKFMFNLKAANGQVILTSERYASKAGARNGIASVRKNAADDTRYERRTSSADQPYFVLKAANHRVIGRSEMYSGASSMENGIASVKKNGPKAATVDITDLTR